MSIHALLSENGLLTLVKLIRYVHRVAWVLSDNLPSDGREFSLNTHVAHIRYTLNKDSRSADS